MSVLDNTPTTEPSRPTTDWKVCARQATAYRAIRGIVWEVQVDYHGELLEETAAMVGPCEPYIAEEVSELLGVRVNYRTGIAT